MTAIHSPLATESPERLGRLLSVTLPLADHGPSAQPQLLDFVQAAKGRERFYWENTRESRAEAVAFAGMGIATEITGWGETRFDVIEAKCRALFDGAICVGADDARVSPRLFGGFAFRDDFVPDYAWADFLPAHFILPHYQFTRIGERAWLTINTHIAADLPDAEVTALIADLRTVLRQKMGELHALAAANIATQAAHMAYPTQYDDWAQAIHQVTAMMREPDPAQPLKKVVLARAVEAQFDGWVDVDAALRYLARMYPDTYRFLFEPRPNCAFMGATPELLAHVNGDTIETMALAGTAPRGATDQADQAHMQHLLNSNKDRVEHQIVIDRIVAALRGVTSSLNIGETGVMTLRNVHHLHTAISGTLSENKGALPIIQLLHPTPALGGEPRDLAMSLIQSLEPVTRGWYAAPVGWLDPHLNGAFGVAIRSMVAQAHRAWLYAGCGIVAKSDPTQEWRETELKLKPMMTALGL